MSGGTSESSTKPGEFSRSWGLLGLCISRAAFLDRSLLFTMLARSIRFLAAFSSTSRKLSGFCESLVGGFLVSWTGRWGLRIGLTLKESTLSNTEIKQDEIDWGGKLPPFRRLRGSCPAFVRAWLEVFWCLGPADSSAGFNFDLFTQG